LQSDPVEHSAFDPFDPFAAAPPSAAASSEPQKMSSPAADAPAQYDAEFADLLGDFSSDQTNGVVQNGDMNAPEDPQQHGDVGELVMDDAVNGEGDDAGAAYEEVGDVP
jgi:hypothetical protein